MSLIALLCNHSVLIVWFGFVYKRIIDSNGLSFCMLQCRPAEAQLECVTRSASYEPSGINCDQYSGEKSSGKTQMLQKPFLVSQHRGQQTIRYSTFAPRCARRHSAVEGSSFHKAIAVL